MAITEAEQIQHEYYYRTRRVLQSQKPQWLSDSAINVNGTTIPLSWNEPLNWLGSVPNASGAQANFGELLRQAAQLRWMATRPLAHCCSIVLLPIPSASGRAATLFLITL